MRLIVPMIIFVVAVVLVLGDPELLFRPLANLGPGVRMSDLSSAGEDVPDGPIFVAAAIATE